MATRGRIGTTEQRQELVDGDTVARHRVADRGQHGVPDEQPDRREADPAMGVGDAILAKDLIQPRAARHQDELDQDQVCPEQGADLAGRGEDPGRGREFGRTAVQNHMRQDQHALPPRIA